LTLVAVICGASVTSAQEVTATITGTITDQSSAAVAGANVTATSVERGVAYTATTNDAGIYRISNLPVGNYDLKVEKTGFQTALRPAFTLVLNQVARIDVEMKVGNVSQTIEVTGAAPVLKTETTQVDTIIDAATNDALPLATRNYVQLTLLSPGAIHPDPSTFNNGDNVAAGARPFINGNREQSNNFLLDGLDNNQVSDNLLGYTPSPDSIQEFNLITNNAPAEFGNFQGGVVSATLKSGTNSFHGDIWEFFRNDVLNANEWGNKINPAHPATARPPLRWNMFGGTLGGPAIKNKLFFFVDYQGQRFDHPPAVALTDGTPGLFSAFTPVEQAGNFAALCKNGFDSSGICLDRAKGQVANQLYNPCAVGTGIGGVACVPSAAANNLRPAFLNNQIPIGMISPVAAALFASPFYPKTVNNGLTANAVNLHSQQFNADQGDIKVDYRISDKDQVSGRFTRAYQNDPSQNSVLLFGNGFTTAPIWSTVGDWTRSINTNLVNDMRFGWNHVILNTGSSWDPSVGTFGQGIGIQNSNPGSLIGLLNLAFGGGTPTSASCGTITCIGNSMVTQSFNSQVWQFDDGITWTHGRHSFKFGGQYWFDIIKVFYSGNSGELGAMTFGANFTASSAVCTDNTSTATCKATSPFAGNGMGDFFLGLPSSFGRGLTSGPSSTWTQTTNIYAGYVQDTWRYNEHLTLNLGLRYEVHTPWIERNDRQDNYNTITQQIDYANQNGASRSLYNGVYGGKALQPRLGFAWTPGWSGGKTVFRGAFTISDYLEGTGTNLRLPINPPFSPAEFQTLYTSQVLPGSTASDGIIAPASSGTSCPNYSCFKKTLLRIWDPNVQPAISDQWNLTGQRQFWGNTTFQLGYVGQRGTHLMVPFDYAQPVSLPSTACGKPPCTGPSAFFVNNPTLAGIASDQASGTQSNGTMWYNALQAVLQKSMGNGLEYQVAYTFSHCMSNNTGYYGTWSTYKQSSTASPYWQNIYDPKSEWAPCYYDSTHVLSGYAIYELPFGKGKKFGSDMNKAVDAVVGGWAVSPILAYHTGFPLALYNNGTDHTGTDSRGLRPDCNGTNTIFGKRQFTGSGGGILWFDPSNYSNAAGFGTCAPQMAQLRGPAFYSWDISIQKNFQLTERFKLQFRSDFLNAFNHVNLCAPNTTVAQATTGQITCAQPARNVQFALKLYY
jgi:hypothetical protein